MKSYENLYKPPKTTKAAIQLAAQILIQKDESQRRKTNVENSIKATQAKITKLEGVLSDLSSQVKEISSNNNKQESAVRQLELDYTLTRAEILEAKSELLRRQISKLSKNLTEPFESQEKVF